MTEAVRIAMFDSGLGGLSVYRALRLALPQADVVYAADTARLPYGDRPLAEVETFARQMIARLRRHDPSLLVIACGTTCSAFDVSGYAPPDLPTLAIVDCGIEPALARSPHGRVGVIATAATIGSGVFQRKLARARPDAAVTAVGAPTLVPLVESGAWSSDQARRAVDDYCAAFRAAQCESVILGCTHYPHLTNWFRSSLGESVAIVDPALECARRAAVAVGAMGPGRGRLRVEVSGDPAQFQRLARALAGVEADEIERVDFSDQMEEAKDRQR